MVHWMGVVSSVGLSLLANGGSVSSSMIDNRDGTATITMTVGADGGAAIDGIRIRPGAGSSLRVPTSAVSGPQGWTGTATAREVRQVVGADGLEIASERSGTFALTYEIGRGANAMTKFSASLKQVEFTATNDERAFANSARGDNVVFTGGPNGGPVVSLPSTMVNFREPPTTLVGSIGSSVALEFETSFYGGQAFKVHAATALSVSASGESNPLGIGLDLRSPVPESWGLSFTPELDRAATYTERSDRLDDGVVTITIPNDASLVGETFYLVVSSSTGGTERDLYSQPMRITIRPSESTNSGVELLPYSF